jgi:peptide/nickel transport system permease protein
MTIVTAPGDVVGRKDAEATARRPRGQLLRRLARRPLALTAAAFLALVVVGAAGASWLAPYNPQTQDLTHVLAGPSAAHWLGTDELGRDVLSRLMFGARVTLLDVAEALVVFAGLGITLGMIAGFVGGWADRVITRFAEIVLALPGIIVLLMVLSVFPANDLAIMITLGLISCPVLLRVVRASTLAIRGELYIKAARLSGLTSARVMRHHVLPRLAGPITVQMSLFAASAVIVQSALSFLGLSSPETKGPSWGNMIGEASDVMSHDPWLLVPTGGAVALTVMALGLLGDAVHDVTAGRGWQPRSGRVRRPGKRTEPTPSAPSTEALLSVRGLTIAFVSRGDEVTVVRDVSFDVAPGEAVGIVGESGCGKSMTIRALLGLLPPGGQVTSGRAMFGGHDLAALPERELSRIRGRRISLISQEPMSGLDPSFRVGSQLTEVIRRHNRQLSRCQARDRAAELLAMVNMPEPADVLMRYPHELSGGMAQRVSIALALAGSPELLIADEPTTALDVTVQAGILALLRDLRDKLGMAIILVTHDWGVLADLCDRAMVMYAGEMVEQAPVEAIYRSPWHPYTEGLLASNPHLAPVGGPLPAIPGAVPAPSGWPPGCHFWARCGYATSECAGGPIPMAAPQPGRFTRCLHHAQLESR